MHRQDVNNVNSEDIFIVFSNADVYSLDKKLELKHRINEMEKKTHNCTKGGYTEKLQVRKRPYRICFGRVRNRGTEYSK